MNIELDFLDTFDLPFKNPFRKPGESKKRFIARCNRSMAALKANQRKLFGGGTVYRNKKNEGSFPKSGRNHPKLNTGRQ
jgi:hypothetical protein